jgi:transposase
VSQLLLIHHPQARLAGDTARQTTSPEVKDLRAEAANLKEAVADLTLKNRLLTGLVTAAN